MEKLFELTFQDQTLNPQVGTFTDASQTTGTFTLEDGEYYLTNADTKGFYAYAPIAIQPDSETDNKVTVEFDLKVATASVNTHTIIGTYAGVDGSGIPTGAKITLQYNAGDIELVLGSGATETLIAAADVVVDQWYHFRINCALAPTESTYEVKIDGVLVTTVTGATTDYELGIIGVLGTDLHACDECGIKNIRLITDNDYFVGRTALNQAFKDVKGYVDATALESLSTNSIPFHNAYPRCKYLGTTITDAQNTAIFNRTYDDLFIGDYWTINGVNWRIVAIDYYYNVGDTNFDKGNVIVMPDTVLYSAQMNTEDTTAGAYAGSLMRTQNLNNARTIAQNAFGSHLANHRILLTNSVDALGPNSWRWYDSDGVELPNEVQIYGTRIWGSAFDVATQKQQFPLLALAPQFVNIRQTYWLQDVSLISASNTFAFATNDGYTHSYTASHSLGVRPSVTLSYI
ncbi:MAG: hypothetical protein IIY78_02480 [Clostridia bacterium]|nr:hypothetical protein [Clostridia bacterium]